ncbi:carbon-nitrogen hydrolase family protein [Actinoplanes sp. CA-054009]
MLMSIVAAQVPAVWNVEANLATVRDVLGETRAGEVVVFPEGLLSGYGEDLTPLSTLDPAAVTSAVAEVARLVRERQVYVFCGSLLPSGGQWHNAGLFFSRDGGPPAVYRKINLAMNERGPLRPGDALPTIEIPHPDGAVTAGVQLCREIRFPEQWQHLAAAGAQLFVYLTNAVNPREPDGVWRSHLVSRAAENQRHLVSANIPGPAQHCPTMVVSPRGEVLAELPAGSPGLLRQTIDLSQSADWYLGQRRRDVVSVDYHPGLYAAG